MPAFHVLCGEKKSIPFLEEDFDLAGAPVTEEEQGVRNKERQMVPLLNDDSEGIHAIAHICVAANHIDSREGGSRIPKYGMGHHDMAGYFVRGGRVKGDSGVS